jgi:DNA polymerase III delta subunit
MIYIVHGDDISKSRILIQNQQKKLNIESRIEIDITDVTPEEIYEKSHSNDLFGNPPFIVLDITSAGRMNMEKYIEMLEKVPVAATIIILSGKSLPQTNAFIKNVGRLRAKTNANEIIPQSNIFSFVDAVFYRQREKAYLELSKLLKDQVSPFEILSMFFYGLRTLASAKFSSPAFNRLHDFVKRKALSQANLFTENQIKNIFEQLRIIDMKSKLSEIDEELLIPMAIEKVLNS